MIRMLIFIPFMLILLLVLIANNQTGLKFNNNMILGVTLPNSEVKNSEVVDVVNRCKKKLKIFYMISFTIISPVFLTKYLSITLIYSVFWTLIVLVGNEYILRYTSKLLSEIKHNHNWYVGQKYMVSIDTIVTREKNKIIISPKWFIPSILISIMPIILMVYRHKIESLIILTSISTMVIVGLNFVFYLNSSKKRNDVCCHNSDINFSYNKVNKRLWTKCWIILATIDSIVLSIICIIGFDKKYSSLMILISISVITIISIFVIFMTRYRVYNIQDMIKQSINNPLSYDDDEYWKKGCYYNENDNRLTVEKRIGIGYTLNMANTSAKFIICGISLIVTAFLLALIVLFIKLDFTPINLNILGNEVEIDAPMFSYEFSTDDIVSVELIEVLSESKKIGGTGTDEYYIGNFKMDEYGLVKMYVYKKTPPFIVIHLKDTTVIFNSSTSDITIDKYEALNKFIQQKK